MSIDRAILEVYEAAEAHPYGIKTAVKYISEKLVVRLTRRTKYSKRNRRNEFVLTVGQPNYLERKFVKDCKKAGEPFPVKKVQIKFYPVKKKKG